MKKLILTAVAVFFATMGVSAQGSKAFDKGYRGSVNAGGNISVTKDWVTECMSVRVLALISKCQGMM